MDMTFRHRLLRTHATHAGIQSARNFRGRSQLYVVLRAANAPAAPSRRLSGSPVPHRQGEPSCLGIPLSRRLDAADECRVRTASVGERLWTWPSRFSVFVVLRPSVAK